jgi:hypothetical protein
MLGRLARLLVGCRALARSPESTELHQPVGPRVALEQREQLRRRRALVVGCGRILDKAPSSLTQLLRALRQVGAPADL